MNIQFKIRNWQSRPLWQKTTVSLIAVTLLFFVIKAWCFSKNTPSNPTKIVETEQLKLQNIQQSVRLLGTIHPKHTTVLIAKGSGTLDALVSTGEKVKKGTLIAKIDNADLEKNLQLFEATETLAKSQFDRIYPLLKTGYVSAKDVEEKKQVWINAQKDLSKTKIELDNLRFFAPFDGIVGAYKKREGAQINQGDLVVTMYDPSTLVVDFDIPCTNLSAIHKGQEVHILNKQYSLSHVQRMLDDETHMCPADVDINCDNCLIGSSIHVDLIVAEKQLTIVVPYQALFLKNSKPFVYVVEKGKVALVGVQSGLQQQDKIEITSGLKPGQQLIIKGQERLYPTLAVEIYKPSPQLAATKTT